MASPLPIGTPALSGSTADTTSHAFDMPSGCQVGEMVLAIIVWHFGLRIGETGPAELPAITIPAPTGWVQKFKGSIVVTNGPRVMTVFSRIVDGTEGSTETFTTSDTAVGAAVITRHSTWTDDSGALPTALDGTYNPPSESVSVFTSENYNTTAYILWWDVNSAPDFIPPAGVTVLGDITSSGHAHRHSSGVDQGPARAIVGYIDVGPLPGPTLTYDPVTWTDTVFSFSKRVYTYLFANSPPADFDEWWDMLIGSGLGGDQNAVILHSGNHNSSNGDDVSGAWSVTQDFAAASSVVVTHALAGHPRVVVVVGGEEVEAEVTYNSDSQITVVFSEAQTGRVQLS